MFGHTAERRMERRLMADYEAILDEIAAGLKPHNHTVAAGLAALPLEIRGFGHVKEANLRRAKVKEADLLARFRAASMPQVMAAAE
jgi:indolepyruvate ferredoxin oxidoreductase